MIIIKKLTVNKNMASAMFALFFVFSANVIAHGGQDPQRELNKKSDWIKEYQASFNKKDNVKSKRKNLSYQIDALLSRVLLLRNELAECADIVCLKRADIDYLKELEKTLSASNKTLKQLDMLLNELEQFRKKH